MSAKLGKSWSDKITITDGKKRMFKRLQQVGSSYALFLPKVWVDFMCTEDKDGRYWVEVTIDMNKITITSVKETV